MAHCVQVGQRNWQAERCASSKFRFKLIRHKTCDLRQNWNDGSTRRSESRAWQWMIPTERCRICISRWWIPNYRWLILKLRWGSWVPAGSPNLTPASNFLEFFFEFPVSLLNRRRCNKETGDWAKRSFDSSRTRRRWRRIIRISLYCNKYPITRT